jgi:hypothetical protein
MPPRLSIVLGLLASTLPLFPQPAAITLDTFDSAGARGAPLPFTSWEGQITRNATSITVGGTARDDNGWGAEGLNLNATGMTAIAVTAQRDPGNAAGALVIEFQDQRLNSAVFSTPMSGFPTGAAGVVQIPIITWPAGFDRTRITGWTLGGGTPPPGSAAFRLTLENLELTAAGGPPVATVPVIEVQPQAQTIVLGGSVTFAVIASGTPAPSYQWRKDGSPITGATGASLILSPTNAAHAGVYTVLVSNSAGSVVSNPARLTFEGAPIITQHPGPQTAVTGGTVTFTAAATGSPAPALQWLKDGTELPGATLATLTLSEVTAANVGSYALRATNPAGSATSNAAALSLEGAPLITVQPVGLAVPAGGEATLTVAALAAPAPTYQWRKDGVALPGATLATLRIATATPADAGAYTVVVTNPRGTATSDPAVLSVRQTEVAGTYFGPLAGGGTWALALRSDRTATFLALLPDAGSAVVASTPVAPDGSFFTAGTTRPTGTDPTGTGESFELRGRIADDRVTGTLLGRAFDAMADQGSTPGAGVYRASALLTAAGTAEVLVGPSGRLVAVVTTPAVVDGIGGTFGTGSVFTATSARGGQFTVALNATARWINVSYGAPSQGSPVSFFGLPDTVSATAALANLSIRTTAGTGAATLIAGFALSGGTKPILVRGIGPALEGFGVTGVLPDPRLELLREGGTTSVGANDNWTAAAAEAFPRVGAFGLPAGSRDAALVATLDAGTYTAQLTDASGAVGIALLELYDAGAEGAARLTNVSARSTVGTGGAILIAGFTLSGAGPRRLLIRAVGPTLATFGVDGALADPRLDLFFGGGSQPIASNNDWDQTVAPAFETVGAFALRPNSFDSVLLVTLAPGSYTAQVSGADGTTGVALVEIYEVP